jgi:hypothetical protein
MLRQCVGQVKLPCEISRGVSQRRLIFEIRSLQTPKSYNSLVFPRPGRARNFRWEFSGEPQYREKNAEKRPHAGHIKGAERLDPVRPDGLEAGDVRCLQALGAAGHFEFNRLPFVQRLIPFGLNR